MTQFMMRVVLSPWTLIVLAVSSVLAPVVYGVIVAFGSRRDVNDAPRWSERVEILKARYPELPRRMILIESVCDSALIVCCLLQVIDRISR